MKAEQSNEDSTELAIWTDYLQSMGLAGGQIAGTTGTEKLHAMLMELSSFPVLTKQEKFNLVNLAEVKVTNSNVEGATLCDICLVVPTMSEWPE